MHKKTTVCAKWYIPCIFFARKDSLQNAKHCYTTVFIYMKVVYKFVLTIAMLRSGKICF